MFPIVRRRQIVLGIAIAVCLTANAVRCQQTEAIAGEWIARLDFKSQPALLRITLGPNGDSGLTAVVSLLPIALLSANNAESRRISDSWRGTRIATAGTTWSFDAGAPPNVLQVEVRRSGDGSTATVRFRSETTTAPIHHLVSVNQSRLKQYAWAYVLPSGGHIYVWPTSSNGPLTYLEETTGRSGTLYPVAPDDYIAGPTSMLPDPVRVHATIREGVNGTMRLTWPSNSHTEVVATQSTAYRREEVSINGPSGRLGCDVLMPTQAAKHPGVVLVPGAGANDRYNVYMIAELFAEHGIAALACDKRGTGTSEGDWRLTSFEQQAQDIAAGVRFLEQRSDIEAGRIGVWALSQGTLAAPIAVAANPEIAFLMLVAPAAMSVRENVLLTNVERIQREGTSAAEITRFRAFYVRYQQDIMDNNAIAIEHLWKEYQGASWLPANMPTAQTLNEWSWQRARLMWPYEPGPVLSKITCPVLAIWGAEDDEMPPHLEKPLLERAMVAARNRDYTLRVIPGADHTLRRVAPSFLQETGYAPEYLRIVLEWLKTRVLRP